MHPSRLQPSSPPRATSPLFTTPPSFQSSLPSLPLFVVITAAGALLHFFPLFTSSGVEGGFHNPAPSSLLATATRSYCVSKSSLSPSRSLLPTSPFSLSLLPLVAAEESPYPTLFFPALVMCPFPLKQEQVQGEEIRD